MSTTPTVHLRDVAHINKVWAKSPLFKTAYFDVESEFWITVQRSDGREMSFSIEWKNGLESTLYWYTEEEGEILKEGTRENPQGHHPIIAEFLSHFLD